MTERVAWRLDLRTTLVLVATGWLASAVWPVFAQTRTAANAAPSAPVTAAYVPTLTFDVASIRESPCVAPCMIGSTSPAHASNFKGTHITAMWVISMAYGVNYYHVSGAPDWVDSEQFNIQAKADSSVDDLLAKLSDNQCWAEKQHMLQVLLADRFKLQLHKGWKDFPSFALTVAKSGPKFPEAKVEVQSPDEVNDGGGSKVSPIEISGDPLGMHMIARGASMDMFAANLTAQLQTIVSDKTGLRGNYDFKLDWSGLRPNDGMDESATLPPLFTAVQEQLGLKIEPAAKAAGEILVIDHIEKASEN